MINIVYTNSNCIDVFNIFKSQHDLFCDLDLFVISDTKGDYVYNNKDPYYLHWVKALSLVKQDYFIYNQEDFILYNKVNTGILNNLKIFLKENPEYSFVRLIRSGENLPTNQIDVNIFPIGFESYPLYSMQATLWNKHKFIELYEDTKQDKWFESEVYEESCKRLNIKGVYYYAEEPKRGINHYDSSIYPYIATAVVKGMWNTSEYPNLLNILKEYDIDGSIRGYR